MATEEDVLLDTIKCPRCELTEIEMTRIYVDDLLISILMNMKMEYQEDMNFHPRGYSLMLLTELQTLKI